MTGRLASLNRFISRSAEKSLPFFKVLKSPENFHWGPEQDKSFEDLKKYLENLAVMTSPSAGAELLLYIATSSSAVSAALVEERMVEGTLKQSPIYFVSEALNGSKLLYSEMVVSERQQRPPSTKKEVQKLTARLASLNRFISRSVEK